MTGFQSSLQFYRGQPALPGGVQGFFSSLWEIFITDLDTSGIGAPWSIFLKILTSANISTGCYDCSHHLHYSFIIVSTLCSSGISALIDSKRAIIQSYNSNILRLEEAFLKFRISRNRLSSWSYWCSPFQTDLSFWCVCRCSHRHQLHLTRDVGTTHLPQILLPLHFTREDPAVVLTTNDTSTGHMFLRRWNGIIWRTA